MLKLYNNATGALIGEISDQQFQFMVDQLEEESLEDRDYAITSMTLAFFESQGADSELVALLRRALGDRDEVIVRWSRS